MKAGDTNPLAGQREPSAPVSETESSSPRGNPFPIVGIGASAGGLEAFSQLLAAIPPGTGMAFVLVQHLDPKHDSMLAELLTSFTSMPVLTITDDVAVQPNHVYVIPPNRSMVMTDGHLRLAVREAGLHLPIDIFFRSLAETQGSRAIGVVLSGNASDGSLGVRAIKAECGLTFAQSEDTARFGGMPRSAVATGAVDYVLPPGEIGRELSLIGSHPYLLPKQKGVAESETLPDGDGEMKRVLSLLHAASKVDFSHYKPTTIRRRIGRRMMVLRIDSMAEYVQYVESHHEELRDLYRDVLISVTSFFREPGSFEALVRLITPILTEQRDTIQQVRIWVPGCATGEETYSLAIRFRELLEEKQLALPIQLFGTDISELALNRARQGVYPAMIAENVSEQRLRRFFTRADSGYQVSKMIRESCIFARHDITKDPPFSGLDIVSCRKLLIYLSAGMQRRVLPILHYALKPTGLLMLGSAETTGVAGDLFTPADRQHRVYTRNSVPVRLAFDSPFRPAVYDFGSVAPPQRPRVPVSDLQKRVDRVIENKYSPDAVVISSDLHIVQFRGHTSEYLDPLPGEASLHLLRMARESLVVPLRRAIHAAGDATETVRDTAVIFESAGQRAEITLEVTCIPGAGPADRHFLIVFRRMRGPEDQETAAAPVDVATSNDEAVQSLQRELAEARDYLRNLREDYEAHSEELRAANEEARSANEELQSANEELGTTKEELQSTNEELTTLNEELKNRNNELGAINSDLQNLLGAVSLGILMVDQEFRVRRFNSAAERLLHLGPHDVGRPVAHIRGRIETPHLEEQVRSAIDTLRVVEEEVQDLEGRWYSVITRPYRTLDDRIAGAVITLQDIDVLRRGLRIAEEARDYAEGIIETVREPLVVLDSDMRVRRATTAYYEIFLTTREETEGRLFFDLGNGQWSQSRLRELLGAALFRSEIVNDFEIEHEFPHIGKRTMRLNARRIIRGVTEERVLLLAIEDVTARREIAEIRFQRLFESAKDGIVVVDVETGSIIEVNNYFLELTENHREDLIGKVLTRAEPFHLLPRAAADIVPATSREEIVRYENAVLACNKGRRVSVDIVANGYMVGNQRVVQLNVRDVTERRRAELELRESEARFRLFVESVKDYALFQLDVQGKILTWNTGAERLLGWEESEVIGRSAEIVFVPEDIATGEPQRELGKARTTGSAEDERWHIRKDGTRFFASGILTQVCDDAGELRGFAKIMRDITVRQEQEEQLRRTVDEKSVLVREIHHRVKNNLQVIVSLLSLQAAHTNAPEVLTAFEETEGRVRAIARIHERLYASDDLREVEFAAYLTKLAHELLALHATSPEAVSLKLAVEDMVLHVEQAIPLGLIANELIVNSLKHGLKDGNGTIEVSLEYVRGSFRPELGETLDDGWAQIRVTDSGPGIPETLDIQKTTSMGFRLVNLLVRQLRGRLESARGNGANLLVVFPLKYKL